MWKFISKLLLFLLLFLISNIIIKLYDTNSNIDVLSDKFDYFAKHKDEYNVVFVGSSSFYRHIVPAVFDNILNTNDYSIKSFNFGVYGMCPPESYFVTKKILAMNPQKLHWVILELDNFFTHINERNLSARRSVYWHDLEQTLWVSGAILTSDDSTLMKITDLYNHVMLFCKNLTNAGRGPSLIMSLLKQNKAEKNNKRSIGPDLDGYMPLENEKSAHFLRRHKNFIEKKNYYKERVALLLERKGMKIDLTNDPINYFERKAFLTIINYIKDKGARPILLMPPRLLDITIKRTKRVLQLYEKGVVTDLISFHDHNKYPMLYNIENRFDERHLNKRTAREFTRLVAKNFMALIASQSKNLH